jgi:hypothetical protein
VAVLWRSICGLLIHRLRAHLSIFQRHPPPRRRTMGRGECFFEFIRHEPLPL